jgi:cbb3-type cytochrome oxidase maturation protein
MSILAVLIPLSIVLVVVAGVVLFWAVDDGQFDDMDTPRILPLLDRDDAPPGDASPRDAPSLDVRPRDLLPHDAPPGAR